MLNVRRAGVDDLDELLILFDAYRQFNGQSSDLGLARQFLTRRLQQNDTVILLACDQGGKILGFTQLFALFSSVACTDIVLLNDLFVSAAARGQGVAQQLMQAAKVHVGQSGAAKIRLCTALSNERAQALYEKLGYQRDTENCYYSLTI